MNHIKDTDEMTMRALLKTIVIFKNKLVGPTGFEPATKRL